MLGGMLAGVATLCLGRRAHAAEVVAVAAPGHSVAAIVAAVGSSGGSSVVAITIDPSLGPLQLRVAGATVDVSATILAKPRVLDDPRNALKLAVNVRRALVAANPGLKAELDANHKAWSGAFARRVVVWNSQLARSPVRGQRIADVHGRAALLEWVGAVVDPAAKARGPAGLATAPAQPAAPTFASYASYIEALVALFV